MRILVKQICSQPIAASTAAAECQELEESCVLLYTQANLLVYQVLGENI